MNDILLRIDSFIKSLGELKISVEEAIKRNDIAKSNVAIAKNEIEARNTALDAREKEIKKVEDIIALDKMARDMLHQAKNAALEIKKERESFEALKNQELSRIAQDRQSNEDKALMLKKNIETFNKSKFEFEKEKEGFKEKLARALVEGAEKI